MKICFNLFLLFLCSKPKLLFLGHLCNYHVYLCFCWQCVFISFSVTHANLFQSLSSILYAPKQNFSFYTHTIFYISMPISLFVASMFFFSFSITHAHLFLSVASIFWELLALSLSYFSYHSVFGFHSFIYFLLSHINKNTLTHPFTHNLTYQPTHNANIHTPTLTQIQAHNANTHAHIYFCFTSFHTSRLKFLSFYKHQIFLHLFFLFVSLFFLSHEDKKGRVRVWRGREVT